MEVKTLKNDDNPKKNDEKKIIKKKIIKKIIKKKKKDVSENNININELMAKNERPETAQETIKHNINEENNTENSEDTNNLKSTTEATEETMDKKEKYELPKIKMKRRSLKNKDKKPEEEKKDEQIKKDNNEESQINETLITVSTNENKEIKEDDKVINIEKKDEILDNKEDEVIETNKEEIENEKIEKIENNENNENNDKIEEKKEENENNINDNNKENNDVEKEKEKNDDTNLDNTKNDVDIVTETLLNANLEEMKNYIGIVTNETIFEYLLFNYYSNEMIEFNLSLNELLLLGDIPLIKKITNGKDMKEKVYHTFNNYLDTHSDIIPIFNDKILEGFIYPKDFLYYIYNCESKQSLTNEEFLINLYKDIDEEKPYGKNRIIYLELNDKNKAFYLKELIEKLDCSIEKKIIIYDPNDNSKLFLISLKTIFRAIVEFQLNNNKK